MERYKLTVHLARDIAARFPHASVSNMDVTFSASSDVVAAEIASTIKDDRSKHAVEGYTLTRLRDGALITVEGPRMGQIEADATDVTMQEQQLATDPVEGTS
jgi:hypothetical protein